MENYRIEISEKNTGKRLDVICAEAVPDLSRQYIKKLIADGKITVGCERKKASYKVKIGDVIDIEVPEPESSEVLPENIPLDIVYEDGDIIVVNKPSGMVVHPAAGSPDGTLVNALLYHTKDLSGINGVTRPGIVHRIDKDTSGLLVVAKNDLAHRRLAEQLSVHDITRQYRAIVKGVIKDDKGTVDMPIGRNPKNRLKMAVVEGGRRAVTHFEVVSRYSRYTEIICRLETGRTHQIRVHMSAIGHPVAGDPLYGGAKGNPFRCDGQLLHAEKLGFRHPRTGKYVEFTAPLPENFKKALAYLEHTAN